MKFKFLSFVFLSSIIVFLSSCLGSTDTIDYSSNASFSSLTFAENDSIPNLEDAVFTLEFDPLLGDSVIVNLDSLPYNTRIDSVFPTFGFESSSAQYLIYENDTVPLDGTDTIDFTIQPIKILNFAADKSHSEDYFVKVNVHKVEPELYVWNKVLENLDSRNVISQKAIMLNDMINYYISDGSTIYLYSSTDGNAWSSPIPVNGLPVNPNLSDMTQFNGKLYLTQNDNSIYSTLNGIDWTVKSIPDYNFKSLLFTLNDSIYAVTESKNDQKYRFASSKNGLVWFVRNVDSIPQNFPVSDFTSLSFSSRSGKSKAIVLGGKDREGAILKSNWSTEGTVLNGKTYWVDLSSENKLLDSIASGASLISYDDKLFLFAEGINIKGSKNHFRQSIDEGLTWQIPDSTYNYLPVNYETRSYQSVVVLKPLIFHGIQPNTSMPQILASNHIFILGGKTPTSVKTDVWTGKLNRKNFLRQ